MAIQIHLRQRFGEKSMDIPAAQEKENHCHCEGQKKGVPVRAPQPTEPS
jgi:hypothetical protein